MTVVACLAKELYYCVFRNGIHVDFFCDSMDMNSREIVSLEFLAPWNHTTVHAKFHAGIHDFGKVIARELPRIHDFLNITSCLNVASLEQMTVASSLKATLVTRRQTTWSVFSFPGHWNTQ